MLQAADCHPTAEQVFAAVRRTVPHMSLATVYKALEALVDAGLAARIAHEAGAARYDARSEAHYHLHCVRTGEVRDLPLPYDPHLIDKIARNWPKPCAARALKSPATAWNWSAVSGRAPTPSRRDRACDRSCAGPPRCVK